MDVGAHVAALEREGRVLVATARGVALDSRIPTCPGWRVADLLAHVGFVHRWATSYVETACTEMVEEPDEAGILQGAPPEGGRCDWVEEGHAALVRALRRAPADLECWTFLPAPSPLAMWARRQAHETAVHRVDVELASGSSPTPVEEELAVDGIDELLFAIFGRPPRRVADGIEEPVTIELEAAGGAGSWTVRVSGATVEARRGGADGAPAVRVRGTPSDLYLLLWHRRELEGLEVDGSAELFENAWGSRGVTWA